MTKKTVAQQIIDLALETRETIYFAFEDRNVVRVGHDLRGPKFRGVRKEQFFKTLYANRDLFEIDVARHVEPSTDYRKGFSTVGGFAKVK